jgi:uncharacterized protein (TIGR00369 family)
LHGGASCVLAETLGSTGAAMHAGRGGFTVGIEINATHHRAASAGRVTGVATQVHGGRTLASYDIVITDDRGRRVCTARLSCMFRDGVPGGNPAPGGNPVAGGNPAPGGNPVAGGNPAPGAAGDGSGTSTD